jgi:hypothetical protein
LDVIEERTDMTIAPPEPGQTHPEEDDKLFIDGFQGTPEEIERQWFEKVYKGRGDSMLQLTWRAVIMGSVLGGVLSLTNQIGRASCRERVSERV